MPNRTDCQWLDKQQVAKYLFENCREQMPEWLCNYKNGDKVKFSDVMSSNVGYYPGSGYDGMLIEIGNISHSVHSFIYVDYGISKNDMTEHMKCPESVAGYHSIGHIEWVEQDLVPSGPYKYNPMRKPAHPNAPGRLMDEKPYCFTEIYERDENIDNKCGDDRFALTILFADGIATYYQLFVAEYKKPPFLFLLQDHGFGGNYDKFGKGGILDEIICGSGVKPEFVLCGDNTEIWEGYSEISELPSVVGGMSQNTRKMYLKR